MLRTERQEFDNIEVGFTFTGRDDDISSCQHETTPPTQNNDHPERGEGTVIFIQLNKDVIKNIPIEKLLH